MSTAGKPVPVYDVKLHDVRHTAASLALQAGANIKALRTCSTGSAWLTLDRHGHLDESDVEAVGVAELLTRRCGQNVVRGTMSTADVVA